VKTVLITGAGSGIGAATARQLASCWRVVLADRDRDHVEAAVETLTSEGRAATAVAVDVTLGDSVADMMAQIALDVGPIHSLFSNAGIGLDRTVEETTPAKWRAVLDVHVKGAFLTTRAVLPQMVERRSGSIVMMGSDYSVKGMRSGAAYAAAKSAIYSLAKSVAIEFAAFNIRCNCVGPGPIETPLLRARRGDQDWEEWKALRAAQVPMGRLGTPEDVAGVVEYLIGDDSAYITGQIIHPNGGQISW
jgi:NAD(P)-dependent dehydrogenase (short-subunit alcohol dehydrogenase family)